MGEGEGGLDLWGEARLFTLRKKNREGDFLTQNFFVLPPAYICGSHVNSSFNPQHYYAKEFVYNDRYSVDYFMLSV